MRRAVFKINVKQHNNSSLKATQHKIMGCNYYGWKIPTKEEKAELIELINNDEYVKASELFPQQIHIGKSSIGWMFNFNHNDWEYFDQEQGSLEDFLNSCKIMNEYGEFLTPLEFAEIVMNRQDGLLGGDLINGYSFSKSTDFS